MGKSSWDEQEEAFFGSSSFNTGRRQESNPRQEGEKKKHAMDKISGAVHALKAGVRQLSNPTAWTPSYPAAATSQRPQFVPPTTATTVKPSSKNSAVAKRPSPNNKLPFSSWSDIANRVIQNCSSVVPICVACGTIAPHRYQYHPFFPKEIACVTHTNIGKCNSCGRFEPLESYFSSSYNALFVDLEDKQRKVCSACFRSVILDSQDISLLWTSIVKFLDEELLLFADVPVKRQMENIPILIVGHDGLNDPSVRGSGHGVGATRGLCMYEYRYHPLGGHLKQYLDNTRRSTSTSTNRASAALSSVLNVVSKGLTSSNITAILCVKGLPRDLAGSILAHEATHAWFKLHPSYDPTKPTMPAQVEEGCCQLVAYLYLTHLQQYYRDDSAPDYGSDGQPTDKKLRQYFRYCIETDTSEVYGEGFRLAAAAFAKVGNASALLEHVAINGSFPIL